MPTPLLNPTTRAMYRAWLAELDVAADAALAMGDAERADALLWRIGAVLQLVARAGGRDPFDYEYARATLEL